MGSHSLIQVYICTALAKCFLNFDVLWTLDMEKRWIAGDFDDIDEVDLPEFDDALGFNETRFVARRFRMRDDLMHRCYLPFICALRLCDRIRPERVAYVMGEYLAREVPVYATG